jgi:hypothetical protein
MAVKVKIPKTRTPAQVQAASGLLGTRPNLGPRTPAQIDAASGLLGGAPLPSPGAPARGATAVPPQPVDPNVLNAQLVANRNVAIGKGEAAYQTGNLGFDYGYNPDGSINSANPYSRAALYQLGYERANLGASNSLAARGIFGGAVTNAQDLNASNYAQAEAANRLGYQRSIHGIQAGQLGTVANAGTGVSDADFAALLKATYPAAG